MAAGYLEPRVVAEGLSIRARFKLENRTYTRWTTSGDLCLGAQIHDPDTGAFLSEGEWTRLPSAIEPGSSAEVDVAVDLPAEDGGYHAFVSPHAEGDGWFHAMDWPFLLVEARVEGGRAVVEGWSVTTRGQLGRRHWPRQLRVLLLHPVATLWRNRRLIRSMVRRDLAARYRGSVGGAAWTIAHPLLLMLTYLFVFGVVLDARFGNDPSRAGFVLYFLAGMLPWLPFSEAVGRAPTVILDNRNFVKKLVFPVETLPANLAFAGLVAELFGLAVFLALLAATRGIPPLTTLWLPAIAAPQLLLTLGCCWFLAAVGVFLRDLGQVVGFLLTLLFFLTPICYPDDKVPAWALWALQGSPIHALVRCYRAVLLEGAAPPMAMLGGLWLGSAAVCVAGHATFWRLRRMFADAL